MGRHSPALEVNWLLNALAGFGSGVLGSMGMGGGGILIICLSLFTQIPQDKAQGINLLFFIPIALLSVIMYSRKKLVVWKIAIPFAILGIIGSLLGTWVSSQFSNNILSKLFGILLLIMGIKELFFKTKKEKADEEESEEKRDENEQA